LYIFFKFYLRSKLVPLAEMDLETEFASIRQWKAEQEMIESRTGGVQKLLEKVFHSA